MLEALLSFLVLLIIVVIVAALILWAVRYFFPEAYTPARLVVGGVALIVLLYALLKLIQTGIPGLP